MATDQIHEEKLTLTVDVNVPAHAPRTTTALFARTKKLLIERDGAHCFVCRRTAEQAGAPLEAHHHPIERAMTNAIDWALFKADAQAGRLGPYIQAFDWEGFDPADPIRFVDDMTVNGLILCREHHTGPDAGIHALPWPLFIVQKYAREGWQFSPTEVIHHASEDGHA